MKTPSVPGANGGEVSSEMDPLSAAGSFLFVPMSDFELVERPAVRSTGESGNSLQPALDYERRDYFVEARDLGKGINAPKYSFTEAVNRFIFG